jgi:hypothetical protein
MAGEVGRNNATSHMPAQALEHAQQGLDRAAAGGKGPGKGLQNALAHANPDAAEHIQKAWDRFQNGNGNRGQPV